MNPQEYPITFSGEMVKAIFKGRKTMTRRIVKPQPCLGVRQSIFAKSGIEDLHGRTIKWPYNIGDRLWVRETFAPCIGAPLDPLNPILYKSDNLPIYEKLRWVSPVFMPRWASRITLEITDVAIQRLRDISEDDAKAEGADKTHLCDLGQSWATYKRGFQSLWTSLYGLDNPKSWDADPWVFVIQFKVIK